MRVGIWLENGSRKRYNKVGGKVVHIRLFTGVGRW